jgi:hypothetical protein
LTRCSDIIAEHNEEIRLWPDNIDRGLDFSSEVYLNRNGITVKKILTDSILAVDLKSDVNIWSFDTNYDAGEFELDWISTKEKNAIRRFKTPDND